jgi:hypothetical protein
MYSHTSGILRCAVTGELALELNYHEASSRRTVVESGMVEIESARHHIGSEVEDNAVLLSAN